MHLQRRILVNNHQPYASDEARRVRRFITVLGVLLVLGGQFLDFSTPIRDNAVLPPHLWLSILGVLLFISSMILQPPAFVRALFARLPHARTFMWVVAALTFSVFATLAMVGFQQYAGTNYIPIVTLWLMGLVCYCLLYTSPSPRD